MSDSVNHPSHYESVVKGVECIDVTEQFNFNRGNAIKYIWRAGHKDKSKEIEDLRKACWYINREIERSPVKEEDPMLIGALVSFIVAGAFWRRWFGGGFGKLGDITRGWKYLILAVIVLAMYYTKSLLDWTDWRMYVVIASFMYHWSRSHGDYFYVYDTGKDEGRIKWIDWVLRKIYGEGNYYNFKGNVTGLLLRYTSTACVVAVCIPNAWFILAGPLTVLAYIITGKFKKPIVWAEFLSGALNFGLLYLCLGG